MDRILARVTIWVFIAHLQIIEGIFHSEAFSDNWPKVQNWQDYLQNDPHPASTCIHSPNTKYTQSYWSFFDNYNEKQDP